MKKKALVYVGIILICVCGLYEYKLSSKEVKWSNITLENVEALAQTEGNYVRCYNYGDIDCLGAKVEFRYDYYNVEWLKDE
ncbi:MULTISPECIES: NVEALA domain-containing protein [Bacteroidaceae]|jgi:hypothetical protein|uniref:NVEALA family protein n=2 Tax=Phocaeicola coprophilus TaxID=387090 RepID=S0F4F0_9BACT|nr:MULTISPECIES: NVEALA domain-containing protein [Bacteroidaceae]EEF74889.1 hypothetical protein BACCOPRO_00363 [Phocaeicola coprophilus DSM 18228 = JCM 13818]QRO23273.1 NVEALA domain-containing protein [Phocaeicola coprophilus]RHA73134.1 hypothetical protein DW921_14095 [Phocaeicola coprophilus]